jgi:N-acetylmuramoyl-L-alanine amidase
VAQYYDRAAWTSAVRPVGQLVELVPSQVRGVAVHWTGSAAALGSTATLLQSARRLEAERVIHVDGRGWSDIAWQVAVDVEGRVFDCRGIAHRSAANGSATVNQHYGAVLWLLGAGDRPTGAMLDAFRDWYTGRWLARYPQARTVVGHRDLYRTTCPGDAAYALVRAGAVTEGDDVALTDAEIDAIADRTRDKLLAVRYGTGADGGPFTLAMLWGELRVHAIRAATGIDVEALAAAVVARLPAIDPVAPVDPRTIAVAVADELAARLNP